MFSILLRTWYRRIPVNEYWSKCAAHIYAEVRYESPHDKTEINGAVCRQCKPHVLSSFRHAFILGRFRGSDRSRWVLSADTDLSIS